MKTKQNLWIVIGLSLFFLFQSNSINAQIVLTNSLSCDVKVQIEEYIFATPTCIVCNSGPITINANSSVTLSGCGTDLCVTVTYVGGNFINWYNHANYGGGCHGPSQWITSQSSTGECPGGWTASWGVNNWVIQ